MRRIKVILAVVALLVAMMVFAAPAMADSEMSSSGGDTFFSGSGGDFDSGNGFSSGGGTIIGGNGDFDSSDGDITLG
jgi:hypothetical protein